MTEIPVHLDPTRPEYMMTREEITAAHLLRDSMGLDIRTTFQFWETAIARLCDGEVTDMMAPWDIDMPYGARKIRIEVKASNAFLGTWNDGQRRVFRWADPKGLGNRGAQVVVLVGYDAPQAFYWVAPSPMLWNRKSATMVVPTHRIEGYSPRSGLVYRQAPTAGDVLACILRSYHEYREGVAKRLKPAAPLTDELFSVN